MTKFSHIVQKYSQNSPFYSYFQLFLDIFGYFWLFWCWVWSKNGKFTFYSSCHVSRYATYPYLYAKYKGTLKIVYFMAIFGYFWPFLAIFGYFGAGYGPKTAISHSTHHATLADMQHTHICMQNIKVLSKQPILWLFSAIFGYFWDPICFGRTF